MESWGKNMGKQALLFDWVLFGHISETNVNSVFKISYICAGIFNFCSLEVVFMPILLKLSPKFVKIYAFLWGKIWFERFALCKKFDISQLWAQIAFFSSKTQQSYGKMVTWVHPAQPAHRSFWVSVKK